MAFFSFDYLWKWVMESIYKTSESRYEWSNFCQKALLNKKGEDLKRRLIVLDPKELNQY